MTESIHTYILKSYNEIEALIEDKKNQLLKLYLNTLESTFSKLLNTKPLNFFPGDTIDLPMPDTLDSYNYLRFVTDSDLTNLALSLSKTFEPFIFQIKWMSYMHFSSYGQKIVGVINFSPENQKNPVTSSYVLNNEVCTTDKWIEHIVKKILVDHYSKITDSLNKHFNPINFPKCLDKSEFFNYEFKYKSSNLSIYNLTSKDVTKKISNYVNKKLSESLKMHFPKTYPNFDITENIESDFTSGFLTENNFVIKIKLMCYYNPNKSICKINSLIEEY